jgi:hypothetical protein
MAELKHFHHLPEKSVNSDGRTSQSVHNGDAPPSYYSNTGYVGDDGDTIQVSDDDDDDDDNDDDDDDDDDGGGGGDDDDSGGGGDDDDCSGRGGYDYCILYSVCLRMC